MHQDIFKGSLLGCSENISNTALTIDCTINMSIDCNGFQVPNPMKGKIYLIENQDDEMLGLFVLLKIYCVQR